MAYDSIPVQLMLQEQEEERQRFEEEARAAKAEQQAQLEAQQKQEAQDKIDNPETVRDAAYNTGVEEEQPDRGFFTQAGEWIQENLDPLNSLDNTADALVERGYLPQGVADFIPSREEFRGDVADVPVVGQAVAAGAGVDAFAMTPVTLGARLSNQDASFSQKPTEMEETWGGEMAFELGRLLAPTLIGLPAGVGGVTRTATGALAAEAALETINQRSADDLIFGREQAIKMGEAAEALGYDGKQLTQDLIEGKKPSAQAIVAVAGFMQNFGINIGFDQLLGLVGRNLGNSQALSDTAAQVSKVTGKNVDEVQASLNDIDLPTTGRPDYDINEVTDIDTFVPKAPEGQVINEEAIIAAAIKREAPNLTDVDVRGFTNYRVFSKDRSLRTALEEASNAIIKIEPNSKTYQQVINQASVWTKQFVDELNTGIDLDGALDDLPWSEMIEPLDDTARAFPAGDSKNFLTEQAIATQPGATALTLVGEELGQRLNVSARNITNLDNGSKDYSAAVETFLNLLDKGEQLLMPLRRFKARWNVGGVAQQTDFVGNVSKRNLIKDAKQPTRKVSENAPSEAFQQLYKDADAVGQTPRQLWEAYQAGDIDAGKTLNQFFNVVSYAPPNTALAHIDKLEGALFNQLKKGNKDATTQLLYANYLTRLAPQTASIASGILNVIKEPLGLALSGEGSYALGQTFGAITTISDALRVGKRVYQNGMPINSGTKFDTAIQSSKSRDIELDQLYDGTKKELAKQLKEGESPLDNQLKQVAAWWNFTRQRIANNPMNSMAARALQAGDESIKVLYGSMSASGMAFREATEMGLKRGTPEFKALLNAKYKEVFKSGVENGVLKPGTGVLEGAKALTFSGDIPTGKGNTLDDLFGFFQDGAKDNFLVRLATPFTRVSYWTMEKGGIMLAGSLPPQVGKKLLTNLVPRYKKVLAGEMGEVARLQLKSDLAFANYSALMVGSLAGMGFMTGSRPREGMPRDSFIFPWNNEKGYVAVPYGRLEPVASAWSVISDVTQAFQDELLTQKSYDKFMGEVLISLGLSTLDKSFLTGMTDTASLLDVSNFGENTITAGIGRFSALVGSYVLPIGGIAGMTRMAGDIIQPYDTVSKGDPSFFRSMFATIAERNFGGLTNPVKINPMTGQPYQTTAQLGEASYWKGRMAALVNEAFVPGKVKGGETFPIELANGTESSVMNELDIIGYSTKNFNNFRTYKGIPLSLEEQNILARDTHDVGRLTPRLKSYFRSKFYSKQMSKINRLRQENTSYSLREADKLLESVRNEVSSRFNKAKNAAGRNGQLRRMPGFNEKEVQKNQSIRSAIPRITPSRGRGYSSKEKTVEEIETLITWPH